MGYNSFGQFLFEPDPQTEQEYNDMTVGLHWAGIAGLAVACIAVLLPAFIVGL